MKLLSQILLLFVCLPLFAQTTRHDLQANGKLISLALPSGYGVNVALEGLRRVRFMAKAPDGRIFATDMYSRADNTRGRVLILDGWDAKNAHFARAVPYLQNLRNPNNVAFYTDSSGQSWLYLPLTDKLVRYRYRAGDMAPSGPPEILARYPDYGLNYKYGGWHLTRTVAFGKVQGRDRLFVTVGSSCNACVETESVRASLTVMEPDGKHSYTLARNLRNAVGMRWDTEANALVVTNMGSDQFGDRAPDDTLFSFSADEIADAERTGQALNAGWPACYFDHGAIKADAAFAAQNPSGCKDVKHPLTTFAAHSSPLGIEKWGNSDYFVALHGAGHPRIGTGYRVVRVSASGKPTQDFLMGFLEGAATQAHVVGRPCGLLALDDDTLLVTDDFLGAIYAIRRQK
jgi:glucose/arabinose dehydrogenase